MSTDIAYCDMLNTYTDEHFTPSQLTDYDTTKVLPQKYSKLAVKLWEVPELYDCVKPKEDSQRYTKLLSEQSDVELYVVTVSSPKIIKRKFEYIHREFPWIQQDHIIVISDKSLLNLDILIDDYQKNLYYGRYHKILFDAPWNKNFNASKNGMVRCTDWSEVYDEIQRKIEARKSLEEITN